MGLLDLDPQTTGKIKRILESSPNQLIGMFDDLDPVTRHWLEQVIREFKRDGFSKSLQTLRMRDFRREPVPVHEFLTSKYLGNFVDTMFPVWRRDISYVETNSIYEWIITGGIGIGKSTAAKFEIAYRLHVVSCLRDPSEFYGNQAKDIVVFGLYNVTLDKADDLYKGLHTMVKESPYFKECYKPVGKTGLNFDNNVSVRVGSSELHALGNALLVFAIDEMNFMKGGSGDRSQAYRLYNSTQRRLESRFMTMGTTPGLVILMSSRNSVSSWLEKHFEEAQKDIRAKKAKNLQTGIHISDYSLWDVKRDRYSKDTFYVFVGDRYSPSEVLPIGIDLNTFIDESKKKHSMDEEELRSRLVEVPVDFHGHFLKDIDGALRDLAGRATISISPLIKDKRSILDSFDKTRQDPFKKNPISISTNEKNVHIMDFVDKSRLFRVVRSVFQPRVSPEAMRFIHVDLGLTGDSCGICMGFTQSYNLHQNYRFGSNFTSLMLPYICLDMLLTIKPPMVGEVPIQKLLEFIIDLKTAGFNLKLVTYDGFQSRHSVQILRDNGIEANVFSVDRDDTPYRFLRAAYLDRRVGSPYNAVLEEELTFLEHDIEKRKVDHPDGKSKDLSDAVAAVIYHASMNVTGGLSSQDVDKYVQFIHGFKDEEYPDQSMEEKMEARIESTVKGE